MAAGVAKFSKKEMSVYVQNSDQWHCLERFIEKHKISSVLQFLLKLFKGTTKFLHNLGRAAKTLLRQLRNQAKTPHWEKIQVPQSLCLQTGP